ncbi:hypothetical protein [Clostridium massiliamazoniense]|uniref:hypothetical protein n=1 Tax=Clostridium massiliamazoniense TaxID=1347366 RepID=UPI0006D76842|nr:hypothetical protein [Clostridium massiliamazoniense]
MIFRLFKNNYKNADERILKETDKILFYCYLIMEVLSLISIPLIFMGNFKLWDFWGVFLTLIICNSFILIKIRNNKLKLSDALRGKDEFLLEFRNRIFRESYYIAMAIIMSVDFFIVFYTNVKGIYNINSVSGLIEFSKLTLISFIIVMIPAFCFCVLAIKRGLFLTNLDKINKVKNKKVNLNSFRLRCLYASIFFGGFMAIGALHKGIENALITGICAGTFWGIFFYITMRMVMKISERNADKNINK